MFERRRVHHRKKHQHQVMAILTEAEHAAVRQCAELEGISIANVIRSALALYLTEITGDDPTSASRADAPMEKE